MELKYKPDFERAQTYWDAFWAHELIDRPCTVIWAQKTAPAAPAPYVIGVEDPLDAAFAGFEAYLESHAFLGEAMPGIRPSFGPDQMAGFLGAPVRFSRENQTSWSEKIVKRWADFKIEIDEQSPCWKRMHEYHRRAQDFCRSRCLLYNIDMHVNIDGLEGLRGAQDLLFDLIDEPEAVKAALAQMRRAFVKVYEGFHRYGDKEHLGTTSLLHTYSRGRYNPIQADFICMMSPDMFRRLVLPEIRFEAEYLDHSTFHLDGPDALRHLDDILQIPQIGAIQWIPGAGQKPQLQWPEVLRRIQAAGKAIVLYLTPEEVKAVHGTYDPSLLVYEVRARSVQEGEELLDWLKKHT